MRFLEKAGVVLIAALLFSTIIFVRNYEENIVGYAGDLVGGADATVRVNEKITAGTWKGVNIEVGSQLIGKTVKSENGNLIQVNEGTWYAIVGKSIVPQGGTNQAAGEALTLPKPLIIVIPGTTSVAVPAGTPSPTGITYDTIATPFGSSSVRVDKSEPGNVKLQKGTYNYFTKAFTSDGSSPVTVPASIAKLVEETPGAQLANTDFTKPVLVKVGAQDKVLERDGVNYKLSNAQKDDATKPDISNFQLLNDKGALIESHATSKPQQSGEYTQVNVEVKKYDPADSSKIISTTKEIHVSDNTGREILLVGPNSGNPDLVDIQTGSVYLFTHINLFSQIESSVDWVELAKSGTSVDLNNLPRVNGGKVGVYGDVTNYRIEETNAKGGTELVRKGNKVGDIETSETETYSGNVRTPEHDVKKYVFRNGRDVVMDVDIKENEVTLLGQKMTREEYNKGYGAYIENQIVNGAANKEDAYRIQFAMQNLGNKVEYVGGDFKSGDKKVSPGTSYDIYYDENVVPQAWMVTDAVSHDASGNDFDQLFSKFVESSGFKQGDIIRNVQGTKGEAGYRAVFQPSIDGKPSGLIRGEVSYVLIDGKVKKIESFVDYGGVSRIDDTSSIKSITYTGFDYLKAYELRDGKNIFTIGKSTSFSYEGKDIQLPVRGSDEMVIDSNNNLFFYTKSPVSPAGSYVRAEDYYTTPEDKKKLEIFKNSDAFKKITEEREYAGKTATDAETARQAHDKNKGGVPVLVPPAAASSSSFVGDLVSGLTSFGFLQYYQPQQALSNLLIRDVFKSNWIEEVDKNFAQYYLGIDHVASAICRKEFDVAGDSVGMVEVAPGFFQFIGHVEGQRSEPQPMLCEGDEKTCITGTCREEDLRCVDKNDKELNVFLYKFTYGVQAPQDEKLTPQRDEAGAISFNIVVRGRDRVGQLYNRPVEVNNGDKKQEVIVDLKPAEYTDVCIVFFKNPKSFDGRDVNDICVPIAQAQGRFITTPGQTTGSEGTATGKCATCW